jgi:hypothetical protein
LSPVPETGIRVDDPDAVFRIIGEGGGFRLFEDHTTKLKASA